MGFNRATMQLLKRIVRDGKDLALDGKVAEDLVAERPLVYDTATLTGRDGRKRSKIRRDMSSRNWGTYDVQTDVWTLNPKDVLAYLVSRYGENQ
jgi:hypothetical protein